MKLYAVTLTLDSGANTNLVTENEVRQQYLDFASGVDVETINESMVDANPTEWFLEQSDLTLVVTEIDGAQIERIKNLMVNEPHTNTTIESTLDGDFIDGVLLDPRVRDNELHEFRIVDREEVIDNLIMFANEARGGHSHTLIIQDLITLLDWNDEYIFSSNMTNDYVCSRDPRFEKICSEILEINSELL